MQSHHDLQMRLCSSRLFLTVVASLLMGGCASDYEMEPEPYQSTTAGLTVADTGQWSTLPYLMPINPIHVGITRTGKMIVVAGSENDPVKHNAKSSKAAVYDWQTGSIVTHNLSFDVFCNGMTFLPDGRALIVGGTEQYNPSTGESRATIYDPATERFIPVESMAHGRWYATASLLSDGRVMTFSGLNEYGVTNTTVEIYKVGQGWSPESPAPWVPPGYPWLHLLPNGNVFYSGSSNGSSLYNATAATPTWSVNVARTLYGQNRLYGSSVLLPLLPSLNYRPRVMILGGHNPATATTETIDLSQNPPVWRAGPPMSAPRIEGSAVLLPDGRVLSLGGSLIDNDPSTASRAADLYDPVTNTMAPAGVTAYARLYHSVAVLLPDARVWIAGSNPLRGTYEKRMEIYTPPYLFATGPGGLPVLAPRPTISSAPAIAGYGTSFSVGTPNAASISSVVLVRPGSMTHAYDSDQRMVALNFSVASATTLTVTAPPNSNIAPPGYYMMFVLNGAKVPSVARFIQLSATPANRPPNGKIVSPGGNVTISAGESVSFAGSGTDPDGSIARYAWIFPDANPDGSTVQNPGAVVFPTAGTYTVSLTVLDNAGVNDPSPPTRTIKVKAAPK